MLKNIKNKIFNRLSSQSSSEKETPSQEIPNDDKENKLSKKKVYFGSKNEKRKIEHIDELNDPNNIHFDSPSQKKLRLPSGKAGRILLGPEDRAQAQNKNQREGFFSTPNEKSKNGSLGKHNFSLSPNIDFSKSSHPISLRPKNQIYSSLAIGEGEDMVKITKEIVPSQGNSAAVRRTSTFHHGLPPSGNHNNNNTLLKKTSVQNELNDWIKQSAEKRRIRHASGPKNLLPYKSAPGTRHVSPFGTPNGKYPNHRDSINSSKRPMISGTTVVTPTNQSPQVRQSKILKMSSISNRLQNQNPNQNTTDLRKVKVTLDQLVPSRSNKHSDSPAPFRLKKANLVTQNPMPLPNRIFKAKSPPQSQNSIKNRKPFDTMSDRTDKSQDRTLVLQYDQNLSDDEEIDCIFNGFSIQAPYDTTPGHSNYATMGHTPSKLTGRYRADKDLSKVKEKLGRLEKAEKAVGISSLVFDNKKSSKYPEKLEKKKVSDKNDSLSSQEEQSSIESSMNNSSANNNNTTTTGSSDLNSSKSSQITVKQNESKNMSQLTAGNDIMSDRDDRPLVDLLKAKSQYESNFSPVQSNKEKKKEISRLLAAVAPQTTKNETETTVTEPVKNIEPISKPFSGGSLMDLFKNQNVGQVSCPICMTKYSIDLEKCPACETPNDKFTGVKKETEKPASKPAFSFGVTPAAETKNTTTKPSFSFGAAATATKTEDKPAFSFGAKPTNNTTKPAETKPVFSFGAPPVAASEEKPKPAFSFGQKIADNKKPTEDAKPKPIATGPPLGGSLMDLFKNQNAGQVSCPICMTKYSIDLEKCPACEAPNEKFAGKQSSDKSAETAPKKPTFSFGVTEPAKTEKKQENPGFAFGAKKDEPKPAFTFGSSATVPASDSASSKPSFQFGAATSTTTEEKKTETKPVFSFGNANNDNKTENNKQPVFSFGQTAAPAKTEEKKETKPVFSFGQAAAKVESNDSPKATGFGFGNKDGSTGFVFGGIVGVLSVFFKIKIQELAFHM